MYRLKNAIDIFKNNWVSKFYGYHLTLNQAYYVFGQRYNRSRGNMTIKYIYTVEFMLHVQVSLFVFFQWNNLIRTFRSDIPLARHRRYMKTYDECFVASDAVEWLHQYLKNNPNFGTNVSR